MSSYRDRVRAVIKMGLLEKPVKQPVKLFYLGLFFRRIMLQQKRFTKDLMRGWRPLEQVFDVDMVKGVDDVYRAFGTHLTLDLFTPVIRVPAEFRSIDIGLVVDGYRMLCGVHYAVPGGSMLVTFPQRGNWSRHVKAYVMGEPNREACWKVARVLAVMITFQYGRNLSERDE